MEDKKIIAFVGMPGAGKSEAAAYLKEKNIPFVRFGSVTDEGLEKMGLPLTPDNERIFREKLRQELGMAAYAVKAESKIKEMLEEANLVGIDGLYSWEEYVYLKERFPNLILVQIFAQPKVRYSRLSKRPIRPVPFEKSRERDIMELEKLNKGGPIAIADYIIENDEGLEKMKEKIDRLLNDLK